MKKILYTFSLFLILMSKCSELTNILENVSIQKPIAKINNIALENLNLKEADLLLDIQISNPNPVDIKLAGFDYNLKIDTNSFLAGNAENQLTIAAHGTNTIKFPLTLDYQEIFNIYNNLKNNDTFKYTIDIGLNVNLPVLGATRIPISKSAKLPTIKTPKIRLYTLKLKDFSLTNASFIMELKIDNPNQWTLNLNDLSYNLTINDLNWIGGKINDKFSLAGKKTSLMSIPFTLNYADVGRSVYSLIKSNNSINYQINGNADIGSSVSFLENFNFPYKKTGTINLSD